MTERAASLPPAGLPGLDPSWSRLVDVRDSRGVTHTWHVLDNGADPTSGTVLCVHGNPTWSYLWRHVLAAAPPGWRVVAVDQLGMGYSDRVDRPRRLEQRIEDLGDVARALGVDGPVVTVAHDWGGPVALGWALAHRDRLRGVVLTNTAVHQPAGTAAPALIRLARSAPLRTTVCVRTPAFVAATTGLSRPALPDEVRRAFAAPYGTAARRGAVGDFVADIPLAPDHPSAVALDRVADGLADLADVPVLLLWGPRDPVFSDRYLRDLRVRLPHAALQRYQAASHLVTEDAPSSADAVARWLADLDDHGGDADDAYLDRAPVSDVRVPAAAEVSRSPDAGLAGRAGDPAAAVVELTGARRTVSFALLEHRVGEIAAGLAATGVRPGDRVALLLPPSVDLTATVYAVWRAGASVVVVDRGLGLRAMGRALRGARPDHVVGATAGLVAARAMRLPARRIAAGALSRTAMRALGAARSLVGLARAGSGGPRPPEPPDDAECAVVFTSGGTGPAKGVVYTRHQVSAQLDLLRRAFALTDADRLVAAFAPFALYGPALGIASAVPDMDVTAPGTLTATALADAVAAVDGTVVFASPAALRNVAATSASLDDDQRAALTGVRLVMSAGAPVPLSLLRAVRDLLPAADLRTPYGMTEVLPVTDGCVEWSDDAGEGVCVGRPLTGVDVAVSPLEDDGSARSALTTRPGTTGEIAVRAAHVKDRYDALWAVERESSRDAGWHRTGDVGHLDAAGRVWVEGRLVHVVTTAAGPVTPVAVEQRAEAIPQVRAAAAVGVGPTGTQQLVVVVETASASRRRSPLAPSDLTAAVRGVAGEPVAAVLVMAELPVDVRHRSKVDRLAVSSWAAKVLAGSRG